MRDPLKIVLPRIYTSLTAPAHLQPHLPSHRASPVAPHHSPSLVVYRTTRLMSYQSILADLMDYPIFKKELTASDVLEMSYKKQRDKRVDCMMKGRGREIPELWKLQIERLQQKMIYILDEERRMANKRASEEEEVAPEPKKMKVEEELPVLDLDELNFLEPKEDFFQGINIGKFEDEYALLGELDQNNNKLPEISLEDSDKFFQELDLLLKN